MRRILSQAWVRILIQFGVSILILWMLLDDVDFDEVRQTLKQGSIGWFLAAVTVKTTALLVHEYRLWLALPAPRPPTGKIISLGLAAGVINLALPARAGDVAAIGFMERECDIPAPVGTAAVGVTSFLEAALFAFFLLSAFGLGAAQWSSLLDDQTRTQAMMWIGGSIACGCLVLFAMAIVGHRWATATTPDNVGLRFIQRTVVETSVMLRNSRYLGIQTGAAAIQVVLVVAAFSLAVPASGAPASDALLAGSLVLGISSLAAFVLPPTMAAGPTAASALVMPLFGVDESGALAYAAMYWLVAHAPAVTMGLPALWARR